ncbi:MAG: Ig-like domain-containing protein [Bacteroidales bacterium]
MRKCFLLLFFAISSIVSAKTYYIATWGSDLNPGTLDQPWATWQRGVTMAYPGDTVYIRGGVYKPTSHIGSSSAMMLIRPLLGIGRSGTIENPICYFAYTPDYEAGNFPILDGSLLNPVNKFNVGINAENAEYIHFKGLTVRWVRQQVLNDQAFGFDAVPTANMKFENCTAHNIGGRGFYFESGAWNSWDGANAPFSTDTTYFINCDAYNLCDSLSDNPGNAADGWKCGNYFRGVLYFTGCRAWNYSDDGIDPSGAGKRILSNCWVMSTTKYLKWGIEGNGVKTSGFGSNEVAYVDPNVHYVEIKNCIAADCYGNGFYNNLEAEAQNNALYLNNTAYKNYAGFSDVFFNTPRTSEYYNNIAIYSTSADQGYDPLYEVAIYRPSIYPHSNNNWVATNLEDGWPGWSYNPAVIVTDADFQSNNMSQLTSARKADGSLPDIDFLKLVVGSDLIDAGINVGLPFIGKAPDMGAFESLFSDPNFEPVTNITVTGAGGAKAISTDNGTLQLSAEVLPSDATNKTITWSITSGADKARINSTGLVTAVDNGTVVAKAAANDGSGVYGTLTITITNQVISVTGIAVTGAGNVTTITTDNGTVQLSASVLPSNATNKTVTWSISSGADKASISTTGLVTALDNGTIIARATSNDGSGIYGTLTITITNQVIPVTSITVAGAGGANTISTDNGTLQLSAGVLPSNATNKTVTWSISSGTDKASISSTGLVTALDNGTVTARATANDGTGKYGTLTLTISNQVILVSGITVTGAGGTSLITIIGGTLQLTANVLPSNATNKTVTWSILSGADKASINASGLVTALGNGTTVARAMVNDGSGVYGTLTITISDQVIPVTSITVTGSGGATAIGTNNSTLQLNTSVLPSNATNKTVTWSISTGTDKASVSSTGLVAALDNGTATIKATANDGSGVSGSLTITISNQVSAVNTPPVAVVNFLASSYSGFVYDLNASGSYDANKDNLTYSWQVPSNISVSSTAGQHIKYLAPVVTNSQTYEFTLNVTDGKATTSKLIAVKVLPYKPELQVADISDIEASSYQSPYYSYNVIDGNIGTMWSANGDNQWLIVTLKMPFSVQHVKMAFQQGQNRESYFDILGSVDKITWDPILNKSASCGFSGDIQVFDFPASKTGKEFKYIKIVGHGNAADTWNYISELKIFGYTNRSSWAYESLPVKIYPNPACENVNVRIDESSLMPDYIQIISMSGSLLMRTKISPEEREFSYPVHLKNGIYILQLLSGKLTIFTQKLVINK